MNKVGFYFTLMSGLSGLFLLIPRSITTWSIYSLALTFHILANFLLIAFILVIIFTHVLKVYKKSKNKDRKWTGYIYFLTVIISISTGLTMGYTSAIAFSWLLPLHLIAGLWTILYSIQHVRNKRTKITKQTLEMSHSTAK